MGGLPKRPSGTGEPELLSIRLRPGARRRRADGPDTRLAPRWSSRRPGNSVANARRQPGIDGGLLPALAPFAPYPNVVVRHLVRITWDTAGPLRCLRGDSSPLLDFEIQGEESKSGTGLVSIQRRPRSRDFLRKIPEETPTIPEVARRHFCRFNDRCQHNCMIRELRLGRRVLNQLGALTDPKSWQNESSLAPARRPPRGAGQTS